MTTESEKWDLFLDTFKEVKDRAEALNELTKKAIDKLASKKLREQLTKELEKING